MALRAGAKKYIFQHSNFRNNFIIVFCSYLRIVSHEFEHTLTFSAAPNLSLAEVNWAGQFRDSNNHDCARSHFIYQYQDMVTALEEGIVNPIGKIFD